MSTNNKKYPYRNIPAEDLKKRKASILGSFSAPENALRASLITRFIKCGKPNCRCANGVGHESLYLSSYYHGYTYLDHVPKSHAEKAARYLNDYEMASSLLAELSEINLELFRRKELED